MRCNTGLSLGVVLSETTNGQKVKSLLKMISEKWLEIQLRLRVERLGGLAWKFLSFVNGVPDRLILMPGGKCYFAELKSSGKKPTRLQRVIHGWLRQRGFKVFIIDSEESLKQCIDEIQSV